MNKFDYKYLSPFKWFVLENFPFIEADFDALTEWQLFCKLGKEMNKIINSENILGTQVENVTNAYIELQNYVNNYFENLDIQSEVNEKLNDMAESGELAEIIAQYLELQGLLCYNTKTELKNASNLVEGSFTMIFGTSTYNDGYTELYKIRTLINTDVIDEDNLIALINYPTLVAEKIPKSYLNNIVSDINNIYTDIEDLQNKTDYFNLHLQPNLIYDSSDNKNLQGSCVSDDGYLYVYNQIAGTYPIGELLVINNTTKQFVNRLTNLKLYHGNDIAYINGNIYVASCQGETTSEKNKKLCIYNITNNTITEENPFSDLSDYNSLIGVSKIDNTHLLCALTKGTENFEDLIFAILDLSNMSYTTLSVTNTHNLPVNYWAVFQACEYQDGFIYLLTSYNNSLMKFEINENTANLIYIYDLPNRDILGLTTGEFEGITKIPNTNNLMINSQVGTNSAGESQALLSYCINTKYNLPLLQIPIWFNDSANERKITYLDNTSTSLYEDGSADYPFKNLTRAIEHVKYCKLSNFYIIRIAGGNNYFLGNQANSEFAIDGYGLTENINIIGNSKIEGCKIFMSIEGRRLVFKGILDLDNTTIDIYNGTFEKKIYQNNHTFARYHSCISSDTNENPIIISGAQVYAGFQSFATSGTYFEISNFSFLMFPDSTIPQNKISNSGSNVIMYPKIYS